MTSDDQDGQAEWQRLAAGEAPAALNVGPDANPIATTAPIEEPRFLYFRCGGIDCAAPLTALREVLSQCPAALPLPHSPEWLLGVFALRAELVGLADPAPLLFGALAEERAPAPHRAALVVGTGARALAWAVEGIGASGPVELGLGDTGPDSIPAAADTGGDVRTPEEAVAMHYAAGVIGLADGRRFTLIDAEALLADMLRALEERPATP